MKKFIQIMLVTIILSQCKNITHETQSNIEIASTKPEETEI